MNQADEDDLLKNLGQQMQQIPKDGVVTAEAEIEMIATLGVEDGETTQ